MKVQRTLRIKRFQKVASMLDSVLLMICLLRLSIREATKRDFLKKTPLQWYNAELVKKPQDVGLWYAKGALLVKQGEYPEAIKCFEKVTELDPDHLKGWTAQAKSYFRIGEYEKSIQALDVLLSMNEEDETLWFQKGEALLKQGRYVEANACYDKAIELEPNYVDAWCGKGNALKGMGMEAPQRERDSSEGAMKREDSFNKALDCFKKVLDLRPDHYEAMASRGTLLCEMGEIERGFRDLERALDAKPGLLEPMYRKAKVLELQGKTSEAQHVYNEILDHRPTGSDSMGVESFYWKGLAANELGRHQLALDMFDKILLLNPRHVGALVAKGRTLTDMEQSDRAIEMYDRAIEIAPENGLTWFMKGKAERDLGKLDDALASLSMATSLAPQNTDMWYERGLLYYAVENLREALRDFLVVLEQNPLHTEARKMKSAIEAKLSENIESALSRSLRTLRRKGIKLPSVGEQISEMRRAPWKGTTVEELVYNGIRLFSKEKYDDSLECFEQALEIDDSDYTLHEWKGDTLVKLGRYTEAIQTYDRAIKLKHQSAEAKDAKEIGGDEAEDRPSEAKSSELIEVGATGHEREVAARSSGIFGPDDDPLSDMDKMILRLLTERSMTLNDIADVCGLERPEAYATMVHLVQKGLVSQKRALITLERGSRRVCIYHTTMQDSALASEKERLPSSN